MISLWLDVDVYYRYSQALVDCQQCYFSQREQLLGPSISSTINDLATKHARDHCALVGTVLLSDESSYILKEVYFLIWWYKSYPVRFLLLLCWRKSFCYFNDTNINFGSLDSMIELFTWIFILFSDEEWLCLYGPCLWGWIPAVL